MVASTPGETITDPILAKRRGKKANEGAMLLAGNFRKNDASSILMIDQMQAKSSQQLARTPRSGAPSTNEMLGRESAIPSVEDFIENVDLIKPGIV